AVAAWLQHGMSPGMGCRGVCDPGEHCSAERVLLQWFPANMKWLSILDNNEKSVREFRFGQGMVLGADIAAGIYHRRNGCQRRSPGGADGLRVGISPGMAARSRR